VGYVKAEPGAISVIPGRAAFPVELRDLDAAKIDRMWEHIQQRFAETDRAESVETRCSLLDDSEPARADPTLQGAIHEAAKSA
jgi:metal-dependent amidase/aminoacylase/carboxypeptidase family protein